MKRGGISLTGSVIHEGTYTLFLDHKKTNIMNARKGWGGEGYSEIFLYEINSNWAKIIVG